MPRKKRRGHRRARAWTEMQLYCLGSGSDFFREFAKEDGTKDWDNKDLDAIRAAWEDVGAELLAAHIEHYPCSRPWSWWQFDAPEERVHDDEGEEPQHVYLDRLQLLTLNERRIMQSPDWEPWGGATTPHLSRVQIRAWLENDAEG